MSAREYLESLEQTDNKIKQRHSQKEELRHKIQLVKGVSFKTLKIQATKKNKVEDYIVRVEEIEKEIDDLLHAYFDEKNQIIKDIQSLDDTRYMNILYKYYVEGKDLDAIATEMDYSYDRIKHLHLEALKYFEEAYPERCKRKKKD